MLKKTKKAYEEYLNSYYEEMNPDEVLYNYSYGGLRTNLIAAILSGTVGKFIRKNDPIGFTVGYNDWSR